MNAKSLLNAIGGISDKHIMEFVDISALKKQKKKLYKKFLGFASIAASFVIIISVAFIINSSQHKDPTRNINMITVSGRMYEIIGSEKHADSFGKTNTDILKKHGLSYPVAESSVGNKIGVFSADDGCIYNVFDYKPYKGQSVLVVRSEGQYQFALFCNLADNNTISINDLLDLYGFDSVTKISKVDIGGRTLSNEDIDVFYNELCQSTTIASYVDTDDIESVKINVKGDDSDVLTFDYYPDKRIAECAITFYQISDLLAYVLNR